MTNAKVIDATAWDAAPVIAVDVGTDLASLGPGQYRLIRADEAFAVVSPVPLPVIQTLPSITGSVVQGVAPTYVEAVWQAPPSGSELVTPVAGVLVGTTAQPANYIPQALDVGQPWRRTSTAQLRQISTGLLSSPVTVQSSPVTVSQAPPVFTLDPSFGAASYTVGDLFQINLGAATNNATLSVEVFTLGGSTRASELVGVGSSRTWDSTGETAGQVALRVRATNSAGFVLSNTVTVQLNAAASPVLLSVVPSEQVFLGDATGTVTVNVTNTPGFNGSYALNTASLASGPVALLAPEIMLLNDAGEAGVGVGDEIGLTAPFGDDDTPGLVAFDPALGSITASWVWQRDTANNGTFADIAGAPATERRTIVEADAGNTLRLVRRVVQGAATINNPSNGIAIPSTAVLTATGFTDGILFDSARTITASAATDGILVTET